MIRLALMFLVIALVAALLGFNVVAGLSFEAARLIFVVFLVLAALTLLGSLFRGTTFRELW